MDPTIGGRWVSIDPLSSEFPSWSPYNYTLNNPIMLIDPTGFAPDSSYLVNNTTGEITYLNDVGGSKVDYYYFFTPDCNGECSSENITGLFEIEQEEGRTNINAFRFTETENSTTSVYHIPSEGESGFFLEPEGPSTRQANQDQRIPEGKYYLEDYSSTKYSDNYVLFNERVSSNRKILIHTGNTGGDTAGCLLPGCSTGEGRVNSSRRKFNELSKTIDDKGAFFINLNINNAIQDD